MAKSRILLFIVAMVAASVSIAQDKTADSLKRVLSLSKEDTNKVNTLIELSKNTVNSAPDEALLYGTKALQLANSLQFIKGKAYALKYIGIYYYFQGKNVETLDQWLQSLNLFTSINDKSGIANILNNIGSLYYNQADDAKALDYYLKSLTIAEALGDKFRIASALQNIGNTYQRKKNLQPKAVQYFLLALPIFEELRKQAEIITVTTNLGEVYLNLGKVDSSLYFFNKGLKVIKNNSNDISAAFLLNDIGKAYVKKGNYDLAISYQKQSVELARKLKSAYNIGKSLLGLANTYYEKGDIELALQTYQQAEVYMLEVRAVEELMDIYAGLTKTYAKKGNFSKAFTYQSLFTNFKDTIYNLETDKKLSNLQLDFDISKKESEIKLLTKDKALSELDLQKQKTTRNALAIGILLLMVIAFVIYRNYRIKVKTNIILDKQKVQIENLMLNILPAEVATELQEHGHATPRHYESVSVLFTDFKSFTSLSDKMSPQELIEELNDSFMAFDDIVENNQLEKIKTIGDAYMCAGGIPTPYQSHLFNMIKAGLEMQAFIKEKNKKRMAGGMPPWELRVGIHIGPVVAGVVGRKKYAYDIWGNTVNIASRMESNGAPGRVNISAGVYELIKEVYTCSHRGKISAKNVGEIDMYFVDEKVNVA